MLAIPTLLFASPVAPNIAQQIAQNFLNASTESNTHPVNKQHRLKRVAMQTVYNPPYYIFNNEDGGFVIVSGDDCATPILGYSNEGSIDLDNMPIQLQELLQAYALEIQEAIDNNLQATEDVTESWATYKRAPKAQTTTVAVSALISTSWNQYPRYNNKCPSDPSLSSYGGHPTTGCVATAMAQIMKYWGYPEKGSGNMSYNSEHYGTLSANFGITAYDWANMPLKLSSSSSSTQINAVATLMYHCGVAVSMNYNCDGDGSSGAQVIDYGGGRASAEKALKTYFGYASTVTGKIWRPSTSSTTWSNMLKTELDNQRPVLYAGYSPNGGGGHAFICDGYDNNNKFHFNWGWGGSSNGFFSLTALTPSGCNFSEGQQALIGIKPANGSKPAKTYDLYMNTDLTPIGTNSNSSETNPFIFGNTISFTAKIENNGTGIFNGLFKVGIFTDGGDFIAWSNESYHFSLGGNKVTEKKTYTFDGGVPFIPGTYRAYMYYQDDDETDCKLVKTDEGVFLTEYNNVVFNVVSFGNLQQVSAYTVDEFFGNFTTGSKLRLYVNIRNTALLTTFHGKIRLSLYAQDGKRAQIIEEKDLTSSGFPSSTTYNFEFFSIIKVEPGTYYLGLTYQEIGETSWYYLGSISTYPNPTPVTIKAQALLPDEYEVNNSHVQATELMWEIDNEMQDFSTLQVSLHQDADIDYYKLSFPQSSKYLVSIDLYDKYSKGSLWYQNADAQFSYSIGANSYSDYCKNEQIVTVNGPTTLYIRVKPFGMNGLGYYELAGDIAEITPRSECKSVPYIESFASSQGDFFVYNATLPSGFSSIWNWDSQYGMVAKCINGSTKYVSESYLISPCVEIPMDGHTYLSFRHAAKFFQNTSQMTLLISNDYDATNPSSAHWSQYPIPTYPTGQNWNWYDSGLIELSGFKGQYINIAFKYTSTTSYAPQWEIKDFSIQNYKTQVDKITIDTPIATKVIRNGQLFILLPDGTRYSATGVKVK